MLVGAGVLSLAVGAGTATAKDSYHHRHMARSGGVQQVPAVAPAQSATFEDNHNPAKKYPARHMPDGAIKTSTLSATGNNSAKGYAVRHAPDNAIRESTLPTTGGNLVKRYPKTETTGAASR
jgi:hypothetical protein